MSWGAPPGSVPYQSAGTANGAPGYGPQPPGGYPQASGYPYANGSSSVTNMPPQRPPEHRPPKKKGNPVITRYPPPPGYRGPNQPPAPYGQPQYPAQHHPSSYAAGHPPSTHYPPQGYPPAPYQPGHQGYQPPAQGYQPPAAGYQQQAYVAPPSQPGYAPQAYPAAQPPQHPQPGYPSGPGYGPPSGYPGTQPNPVPQSGYQPYPPQAAPSVPFQQGYPQNPGWQGPAAQAPHSSVPYSQAVPPVPGPAATQMPNIAAASAQDHTANNGPNAVETDGDPSSTVQDEWEFDFDGTGPIWPTADEPVDKNLSLGVIRWYAPRQVTRALPSTFKEAEEQANEEPAVKYGNGESVSKYFTLGNSHEAFLDVRQTDDWPKVKDDPAFVEFPPAEQMDLIPLQECIDRRHRPDEPLEEVSEVDDEETQDSSWNVMDNLERALSDETAEPKGTSARAADEIAVDPKQEDILAKLGVTGAPKPPSKETIAIPFSQPETRNSTLLPGKPPASLPEKPPVPPASPPHSGTGHGPQRANSYTTAHNSNNAPAPPSRQYGSMSVVNTRPAPPAEHSPHSQTNGHISMGSHAFDGAHDSPTRSDTSNHTMVDSGVNPDHNLGRMPSKPSTTGPQVQPDDSSFSRKRSYDNVDDAEGPSRQQDDQAKRKRRSLNADPYGRR